MKISRRPSRSPSFPPVSSSDGERQRVGRDRSTRARRRSIPRSALIAGSATFTTVLSSMIMKRAKHSAPSVHHLRFSVREDLRAHMPSSRSKVSPH